MQRYHSAWVHSVNLGLRGLVRFVQWGLGKAPLRAESEKELRTKENSVIEDVKEFFRQCAIPFIYAWESLGISWLRVVDEWYDFRRWSKDPIDSSIHPQNRQKHTLPHYHRALLDQRDPGPLKEPMAANIHSTTSGSSPDYRDEHTDLPARDQIPDTTRRWHPSPLTQEQDAGGISPVVEPSMPHPYPLEPEQPPISESSVPPAPPKSLERRSTDDQSHRIVRQEPPRQGSTDPIQTDASPKPSTSWLHDL